MGFVLITSIRNMPSCDVKRAYFDERDHLFRMRVISGFG